MLGCSNNYGVFASIGLLKPPVLNDLFDGRRLRELVGAVEHELIVAVDHRLI